MSDHDAAPDPMDEAYVRAEAMLSDDAARAARRARVLAAVAREPAASATLRRRPGWGRGGWLAVACVVALSLFVTAQIYQPTPFHPLAAPKAPVAPTPATTSAAPIPLAPNPAARTPATRGVVSLPAPPAPSSQASASGALAAAPKAEKSAAASEVSRDEIAPIAPPPPPPVVAPTPRAFPAAAVPAEPPANVAAERPAPPPAANSVGSLSAGASDEAVDGRTRAAARRASTSTLAGPPAAEPSGFRASAGLPSDPAARLRAAAAAGRTAEVEALLGQGAPVDAPDAAGDTALMKSLEADRPAVAAALRRHGASLDHKNHAGESARDIATAKGDPDLDQAIGLSP